MDKTGPDYELVVKKFSKSSPDPQFQTGWEKRLQKYSDGLTLFRSNQCPHSIKFADEIAEAAEQEYKLKPRIIELKTFEDAQTAPTPYPAFSLIYNGKLLADHQISRPRFHNIMKNAMQH